jgi:replicative DNA helicase
MRDPYSIEAEHGLLGAMMQRPELIDSLSDDLSAESFYFPENAEVYRGIMAVRAAGKAVDFLTVGNHIGSMLDGSPAFAYCAEIVKNTPSVVSAKTYAGIVRERAIDRALYDLGSQAMEISQGTEDAQAKIAAVQAAAMAIDCGSGDDDIVKVGDVLVDQLEVWQERHDRHTRGETLIGLSTGLRDLDENRAVQ